VKRTTLVADKLTKFYFENLLILSTTYWGRVPGRWQILPPYYLSRQSLQRFNIAG